MYILKRSVKKLLISGLVFSAGSAPLLAQQADTLERNPVVKNAQTIQISGTVTEASTGRPLPGINVTVSGFSAALTDENGNYKINVPHQAGVILFSGSGYQLKEAALKGRTTINMALYEDTFSSVYDKAALPHGTMLKNRIPYSVVSVSTNGAWNRPMETPDSYLQGKAAGLDVIRRSGTSDIGADMYLRGYNSIYGAKQPLIVVDGVIYDNNSYGSSLIAGHQNNPLANIDLKDIDNITLIKDGSSTYGTRGGNGVLLITTGRAKDVATRLDFAAYGGYNFNISPLPVMQADNYRIYLSDILKTRGLTDAQIQAQPYMSDEAGPDYYTFHQNTGWQNTVSNSSASQNYYLKVTGGDDIATYALSLGLLDDQGIIRNTGLTRYQTRFNGNLNLSAKLKANVNLAFTRSEQDLNHQGLNSMLSPVYLSLTKAPFLSPNEVSETGVRSPNLSDVDVFGISNPAVVVSQNLQAANSSYRFAGSFGFNYLLSKKMSLNTIAGVTFNKVRENSFIPNLGITSDTLATAIGYNQAAASVQRLFSVYNDTWLSYNHNLNANNNLSANAGVRFNSSDAEYDSGLSYNTASDDFITLGGGQSALRTVGGSLGKWNWLNTYLNVNYSAQNKYFITFDIAADASSRFGTEIPDALSIGGVNFAILPSVAASWLVSSEDFMADMPFIESLKLRASYGLAGNDEIGNYSAKTYYTSQNFLGRFGLVRGNIGNPELKWETNTRFNAGIDAAFLKERLSLSVDFYRNQISDMIIYEPVYTSTGFRYAVTNSGGMRNTGVELAVNGRLLNRENLKWDMGLVMASNKNRITRLPDNADLVTDFGGAYILSRNGEAANLFYGYQTNGVYASDAEAAASGLLNKTADGNYVPFSGGDIRFVDLNHDDIIDENDRKVIGNPNPKLTGGYSNRLTYKRWGLDALFTFSVGNDIYNGVRASLESMSGVQNQTENVMNRWRANGQVTDVPKAVWGDPMRNSRFSDRWIEDGSYLRLRSLSVTYNVPLRSQFIRNATVYALAENLLTFSRYLGYDPEFNANSGVFSRGVDIGMNPQFKSMQLGVRIGL